MDFDHQFRNSFDIDESDRKTIVDALMAITEKHFSQTGAGAGTSGEKNKAGGKARGPRSKSTSSKSGTGEPREYPTFNRLCAMIRKYNPASSPEDVQTAYNMPVTICDNFKSKEGKSYGLFGELSFKDRVGEEIMFGDLHKEVAGHSLNVMTACGLLWGMLADDTRKELVSLTPPA